MYASALIPPVDGSPATAEVLNHFTGEIVCRVEADTANAVQAILDEIGVDLLEPWQPRDQNP